MKNVGIIGLGIMGGSFGRTLVKKGNHVVFGYDVNPSVMKKAEMVKAFNYPLTKENAKKIDILIISVYPNAFEDVLKSICPFLKKDAIIVDFCGIKRNIVGIMREYEKIYPSLIFVGGHPMAGREFSGIDHSSVNLYDKGSMILVNVNADIFKLEEIKKFFLEVMAQVVITTSEKHDEMIAYTSQLCHIVSNAFIKSETAQNHYGFSAGSYKDLTRVARLNSVMWTDLMLKNKDKLSKELGILIENLQKYQDAIEKNDAVKLNELLKEGNDLKLQIDVKNGVK